ncbi:MAG: outer membrane protein assembly factor BamB family protein [Phycisphaerae bacterium]
MNRTRWRLGFMAILLGLVMGLPAMVQAAAPISKAAAKKAGFEQLWELPVGIGSHTGDSVAKLWQLGNNLIILTRHGYMVCIRAQVGTIRWTIKIPGTAGSISRPEPFATHQFMLLVSGHLLILDTRNGTIIHNKSLLMAPGTNPIMNKDTILIGALHDRMTALSAKWPPRQLWFQLDRGDSFVSDPVVVDGEVVFGSRNGLIYARDLADGTGGWKRHVGGHLLASPAVAHGVVYFPCMDSNVYAVDANTGISPWITRLPGELEFSPLVLKNHLLVPTGGVGLFSLSMKTGLKQWGPVPNGFRIVGRKGGEIFVATTRGTIAVVNLTTGHVLKSMAYDEPSVFMRNSKTSIIFMASVNGEVEELKPLRRQ